MVLRVKLEIVPFGDETQAREIGRLDIFNKRRIEGDLCEYGVISLNEGDIGLVDSTLTHYRQDGAWHLLMRVLETMPITTPKLRFERRGGVRVKQADKDG